VQRAVAALVAVAIAAASAGALANPGKDLDRARDSFHSGDFSSAYTVLNSLLYPAEYMALSNKEDVIDAYIMLGASLYQLGNRERAAAEYKQALQLDPDRSILVGRFSEGAVNLFDDVKREQKARAERDAEAKALALRKKALDEYIKNLRVYETHPYYVNFVPFGAGQFQNGDSGKGYFFAATQGATLATSMGIFLYLSATYGLVAKIKDINEAKTVRSLQQAEIVSGAAFFAFYGLSLFDAIRHYKPRELVNSSSVPLPPELRDLQPPDPKQPARSTPKKTSLLDRIHLGPMASPQGVGIGLFWEND
jgi:tetratricopeptide (TPR) repeat protein